MDTDNLVYDVTLADFLAADETKTDDNIRTHTITLMHNGMSHTINDSLYYEIVTQLTNQYCYICYTMMVDDAALIQSQNAKTVSAVLAENEKMISAHKN